MKESKEPNKGEVILYKNEVEVRLDQNTVWLSQKQMGELFRKDIRTVNEHILNLFKEKELNKKATIRKFRIVQTEGRRHVIREVDFYNLDVIISVGYRVKSRQGTQFRIWATQVLKKHLVDGFTLNEKRLERVQAKYQELQKAVTLIGNVARVEGLSPEARGIAEMISEYSRALDLLDDFDHQRLSKPPGTKKASYVLSYKNARAIIGAMKERLATSALMGQEKDKSFKSSLSTIYQTFGGKDLYPTIEEKAAHLLYFVTKNHSFVDGNKRIAAALFICFLEKNKILLRKESTKRIADNTLVALTLMIAASKPSEKDMMIKVVLNLMA